MVLFKIIFGLVLAIVMLIMTIVIYVHSKYDNIIIGMCRNDIMKAKNGSIIVIDNVCRTLMNVCYFDDKNNYHEVTWGDFLQLVGTYNLARAYGKLHSPLDKLIIGC